jgi:hypothetical protein
MDVRNTDISRSSWYHPVCIMGAGWEDPLSYNCRIKKRAGSRAASRSSNTSESLKNNLKLEILRAGCSICSIPKNMKVDLQPQHHTSSLLCCLKRLERHEIFTAAQQQSHMAARLSFCLFVCLFVYERSMRACAAAEAIDTRAYNTVKRNGGFVRSSGRCWVLFFYFRGKRNLVKLVGLCHNSLCPNCHLVFFFSFLFFLFFWRN